MCPYCGRALCGSCNRFPSLRRAACSASCAEALATSERAVQLTLAKHVQGARVAAYFLYALAFVFGVLAIVGYLKEPRMILVICWRARQVLFCSYPALPITVSQLKKYEKAI